MWDVQACYHNTSLTWTTCITYHLITFILTACRHRVAIFLDVAGLAAAYPDAFHLARRDSRARLGRSAAIAALTAISIAVIFRVAEQAIALRFPMLTSAHGLNAPEFVAIPFPALLGIASTIIRTLMACAVFGLFMLALRGFSARPWLPATIGTIAIFLAAIDASANLKETPLMLASAAVTVALAFIVIRYILGTNLLAYPLTIAVALLLGNGADLLQNHRPDLTVNGVVEIVIAIALLIWAAAPALGLNADGSEQSRLELSASPDDPLHISD